MTTEELVAYFSTLARQNFGTFVGRIYQDAARLAADPYDVIPHTLWQDLLQFTDTPRDVLRDLARHRTG